MSGRGATPSGRGPLVACVAMAHPFNMPKANRRDKAAKLAPPPDELEEELEEDILEGRELTSFEITTMARIAASEEHIDDMTVKWMEAKTSGDRLAYDVLTWRIKEAQNQLEALKIQADVDDSIIEEALTQPINFATRQELPLPVLAPNALNFVNPAAKKAEVPTLKATEDVYIWTKQVKDFISLMSNKNIYGDEKAWLRLVVNKIDPANNKKDPYIRDFKEELQTLLEAWVPPFVQVVYYRTQPQEDNEIAINFMIGYIYDLPRVDMGDPGQEKCIATEVYKRPQLAHEFLLDFVEQVWLTSARRGFYHTSLEDLKFSVAQGEGTLLTAQAALSTHLFNVRRLARLAGLDTQPELVKRALNKTFSEQPRLYEACMDADLDEVQYRLQAKLHLNYLAGARPQVMPIEHLPEDRSGYRRKPAPRIWHQAPDEWNTPGYTTPGYNNHTRSAWRFRGHGRGGLPPPRATDRGVIPWHLGGAR